MVTEIANQNNGITTTSTGTDCKWKMNNGNVLTLSNSAEMWEFWPMNQTYTAHHENDDQLI